MAFEFLRELLEAIPGQALPMQSMRPQQPALKQPAPAQTAQTAQTAPTPKQLASSAEFTQLAKVAPDFANKLVAAWNGDAQEYQRSKGTAVGGQLLFPAMLTSIQKYVPTLKMTPQAQQVINNLVKLQSTTLKSQYYPNFQDTSVWSHEPHASESVTAKYAELVEEYNELTQE